jgi:hypothetical protein
VGADQNGRNKHANKQSNKQTNRQTERKTAKGSLFNKNKSKSKLQSVCFETLIQEQQKPPSTRQAPGIDCNAARVREEEGR